MKLIKKVLSIYLDPRYRIPVASAGLAYYLTMTLFPIIIILYSMLGHNYDAAMRFISYFSELLPGNVLEYIGKFLNYVTGNHSKLMILFAYSVILITASASLRSLQTTIGFMQGGGIVRGFPFFLMSIGMSLVFVVLIYMGIIALFFGENLIALINRYTTFFHLEYYWVYLRFVLLFVVVFVILVLIYLMCRGKKNGYSVVPGAFLATVALIAVSLFFSVFINQSSKYPIVYSSLSGAIILMFWLYCCCVSIYAGAIVNIARRDIKREKQRNVSLTM
ncbi:MAG: YihY/virulence factor BrkB family protein [Eubacteriales bacterium]|nr:YihY/virulence factor BrkB family protein [Eubacteriales bacterium]